jgi:hypothetical protein
MAQGTSFNREEEFAGLDFHSLRLEDRFVRTMETLIQQPDTSIREASKDRAEAQSLNESLPIRIVRNRMTGENKRILDVICNAP